ncbi:hypothetical protein [Notoacmeibacter ruber]|uniref:Uncharacterized protein n=1 Tax=Notoacmeibacter ruber TaxID=2670375 RepID=A0A3L7JBK7_9HYPH|nr:hypothetical protein [Notoacmeibacter ruber]RLQ88138.1 hypothetical protein D8780_07925 [Notoacmeibacter ruber]
MFSRLLTLLLIFVLGTLFGWLILPGLISEDDAVVTQQEMRDGQRTVENRLEELQTSVQSLAERIGDGARELGGDAAEAIQNLQGDAEEAGSEARQTSQDAADATRRELQEFRNEIDERIEALERTLSDDPDVPADEPDVQETGPQTATPAEAETPASPAEPENN